MQNADKSVRAARSRIRLRCRNFRVDTESLPANVLITNTTSAAVTISAPRISGNDPSDFTQTNDCGRTLDAGTACTLTLTFRPTASGTRTALLAVEGTTQKIMLTGIGK